VTAPTEGRVARPERRWGCRRSTPKTKSEKTADKQCSQVIQCKLSQAVYITSKTLWMENIPTLDGLSISADWLINLSNHSEQSN